MSLTPEIIAQCVVLLRPFMQSEKERRTLMYSSLGEIPLYYQIDWSGSTGVFIPHLIQELESFGELPSGELALVVVLKSVREQVGIDNQRRIDELISQFQMRHQSSNTQDDKQKILILAALPNGRRLDREIREIEEAIQRSLRRDRFNIKIRVAVRPQDVRRAIAEERPLIVHFCGHGMEDGSLLLEDDVGNSISISPKGLAFLFELHSSYVQCVLLNACHTSKTAAAICQYINYAIGMNQAITDRKAILFTQGFYDGLGYDILENQDVFQRAFDEGRVAIQLEEFSQEQIPILKKKHN